MKSFITTTLMILVLFIFSLYKDEDWPFEPNIVVGHPSYNLHGSLHQALGNRTPIELGPCQPTIRNREPLTDIDDWCGKWFRSYQYQLVIISGPQIRMKTFIHEDEINKVNNFNFLIKYLLSLVVTCNFIYRANNIIQIILLSQMH